MRQKAWRRAKRGEEEEEGEEERGGSHPDDISISI